MQLNFGTTGYFDIDLDKVCGTLSWRLWSLYAAQFSLIRPIGHLLPRGEGTCGESELIRSEDEVAKVIVMSSNRREKYRPFFDLYCYLSMC